jgi:hypothetical protein
MEQKNTSVFYNALIWGIIIGLVSVIYSVVLYILGQATNNQLGYLGFIILLGGLIVATLNYRNSVRGGYIHFGTAMGFGILVIVFAGIISSVYGYIQMTVIDPGIHEQILEKSMEKAMEKGLPEDQIDAAMDITKKFLSPVVLAITSLIMSAFIGTVLSVITAVIFKKDDPEEVIEP